MTAFSTLPLPLTALLTIGSVSAFQVNVPVLRGRLGLQNNKNGLYESSSTESNLDHSPENDSDSDVPSMDWLTNSLNKANDPGDNDNESNFDLTSKAYIEEHEANDDLGDVPIPTTGVSVSDQMQKSQNRSGIPDPLPSGHSNARHGQCPIR